MAASETRTVGEEVDRAFELAVVLILSAAFVGLVSTLADVFLAPQVWLAALLLTAAYGWRTRRRPVQLGGAPRPAHLLVLALVALLFRLPPSDYILGGQDEGLYVNIANHIVRTRSIEVRDSVLEALRGNEAAHAYLAHNRAEQVVIPGVYHMGPTAAELEFQFYHLFPVWMALFAGIFGLSKGAFGLTVLSVVSILFFYRLALRLTGSPRVALSAGLLLALNPLHVFFSRFPVTEVPTLTFSLIAFTYLAAFWSEPPEQRQRRWLLLSAAAMGALFVTRVSGFMYAPFILGIGVVSTVMDPDPSRRRALQRWALGVLALYALSVAYGLSWSSHYVHDIYRSSFERAFGGHWRACVYLSLLGAAGLWISAGLAARKEAGRRVAASVIRFGQAWAGLVVPLAIAVAAWKTYRLAWTQKLASDPVLSLYRLPGSGWVSVPSSTVVQCAVYLGPLLLFAFIALAVRPRPDPRLDFVRLFLIGFFAYLAALLWVVPYGPYYDRYLLSEFVPYTLLFAVVAWAGIRHGPWRHAMRWTLLLTGLYSAIASAAQLGKTEMSGLHASLARLLGRADGHDVVLLDTEEAGLPNTGQVKTPLVFTFGLEVATVPREALEDWGYVGALDARYDDLYLLSPSAQAPDGYELVDSTRFTVRTFDRTFFVPIHFGIGEDVRLFLFRLRTPRFPPGVPQPFIKASPWMSWLGRGWSDPEPWGVWSNGPRAQMLVDPDQLPRGESDLLLTLRARALVTPAHPTQRIVLSVDGQPPRTQVVTYPKNTLELSIALTRTQATRLAFSFPDAATPASLGKGNDTRLLAFGLMSATLTESAAQARPVPSSETR